MISWTSISKYSPDAMADLTTYLSHKYNVAKRSIYIRGTDLVLVGLEFEAVSLIDVLEWMSDNWKIYLNTGTYVVGDSVKMNFYLSFVRDEKFYNTRLVEGFDCYKDLVEKACKMGIKGIQKRMRKGDG
jgi:hypothetical protein